MHEYDLTVREAELSDLDELSTLFQRSFHPTSPYMRRTFPDSERMRQWWRAVNEFAILDPDVRLMVVTSARREESIVAYGRWRFYADQRPKPLTSDSGPTLSAGTWTLMGPPPEGEMELFHGFADFLGEMHHRYMSGKAHYLLELVGTIQEAQGTGAGRALMDALGIEADAKRVEIFVETNNLVVDFYKKLGWMVQEEKAMPGGLGYTEFILLRYPKLRSTSLREQAFGSRSDGCTEREYG
jgi:ribosomal protein S18 acetylase RimI-like enzyme